MDNYRVTASGDNRLLIDGRTDGHETIPGMVRYRTVAEILPEGGKAVADSVGITVTDADAVTILVSVATNFNDYRDIPAIRPNGPSPICRVRGKSAIPG